MTNDEYKAKQSELAEAYGKRTEMTAKAWITGNATEKQCKQWLLSEWDDFLLKAHDLKVEYLKIEYEAQADG